MGAAASLRRSHRGVMGARSKLCCEARDAAGVYGGPFSPTAGMYVPVAYWGALGRAEQAAGAPPFQQPGAHHPGEPILAMDALKARIMDAAPGEVKNLIGSVQFVPRCGTASVAALPLSQLACVRSPLPPHNLTSKAWK